MKKLFFLLPVIFFFSCTSNEKLIEQGQYDEAITSLVSKLEKHPGNDKMIIHLDTATKLADSRDESLIMNLKLSGQPDVWKDVYETYMRLQARQETMKGLSNDVLQKMDFIPVDYSGSVEESLHKTCRYYYALAQKKLSTGNMDDQAEALQYLHIIDMLNPDYTDVPELLASLKPPEPVYIYFSIKNKYPNELPPSMEQTLDGIDLSYFNRPGFSFVSKKPKDTKYTYYAEVTIHELLLAPARTEELFYTESADIQDGIAYKVDENGDFVYDSQGNKIEIPKYENIACYVTESIQRKSMMVRGTIELVDKESGNALAFKEVLGETRFEHRSAAFKGDLNALMDETYALIGSRAVEYPDDLLMLNKAVEKLGNNVANIIEEVITANK